MLKDKNILLGVSGGIAAYKAVDLASRLTKLGANVKVILTDHSQQFITPLTFRAITNQPVITKLFNPDAPIEHISLAQWADLIVVAPATANIIGKIAGGIADDLLSTTLMAANSPILIIPAMNSQMYANRIVQQNITKLSELGFFILPPESGRLACGTVGKGRYPDNDEIIYALTSSLIHPERDLVGKRVLITAGACREYLDPMRFISNVSSGKMGLALARSAYHRGAEVTLLIGNVSQKTPYYIETIRALSSDDMFRETVRLAERMDIIVMNAAVTDFKPKQSKQKKIKKELLGEEIALSLIATQDILFELGKMKRENQILIGFAAETENLSENAHKKLTKKNADYLIANHLSTAGQDETDLLIVSAENEERVSGTKFSAAHSIWNLITK